MPFKPYTTHLYTFPIIQHGTHWYHSHTGFQEQIGMYGSFIMNKKSDDPTFIKGINNLPTVPIILSEWTDMNPKVVHRRLHNASDWFAIQKVQLKVMLKLSNKDILKPKLPTNENE